MIEVLVAMVLLATGVVFALAAITYATRATSGTTQATEATAFARKILEIVLSGNNKAAIVGGAINPAYEPPAWRVIYSNEGVAAPFEEQDFVLSSDRESLQAFRESASRFEFQVVVQSFYDPGPPVTVMEGLYSVDLQMRWRDRLGVRTFSFPALFREE